MPRTSTIKRTGFLAKQLDKKGMNVLRHLKSNNERAKSEAIKEAKAFGGEYASGFNLAKQLFDSKNIYKNLEKICRDKEDRILQLENEVKSLSMENKSLSIENNFIVGDVGDYKRIKTPYMVCHFNIKTGKTYTSGPVFELLESRSTK